MHALAMALHLLAAVIWVGGMFFAYVVLRPAGIAVLETPQRLALWQQVFARFFPWVWLAIALLLVSGYSIAFWRYGGPAGLPLYGQIMQGLGIVMMLIFFHVFFAPYGRLRRAVTAQDWAAAGRALVQIRALVGVNLLLGLVVAAFAAARWPG